MGIFSQAATFLGLDEVKLDSADFNSTIRYIIANSDDVPAEMEEVLLDLSYSIELQALGNDAYSAILWKASLEGFDFGGASWTEGLQAFVDSYISGVPSQVEAAGGVAIQLPQAIADTAATAAGVAQDIGNAATSILSSPGKILAIGGVVGGAVLLWKTRKRNS